MDSLLTVHLLSLSFYLDEHGDKGAVRNHIEECPGLRQFREAVLVANATLGQGRQRSLLALSRVLGKAEAGQEGLGNRQHRKLHLSSSRITLICRLGSGGQVLTPQDEGICKQGNRQWMPSGGTARYCQKTGASFHQVFSDPHTPWPRSLLCVGFPTVSKPHWFLSVLL